MRHLYYSCWVQIKVHFISHDMIVNKLFILFIDHTRVQQALPGDLEIYNFGRPRVTQGI